MAAALIEKRQRKSWIIASGCGACLRKKIRANVHPHRDRHGNTLDIIMD
jgi:hypothetical protein